MEYVALFVIIRVIVGFVRTFASKNRKKTKAYEH